MLAKAHRLHRENTKDFFSQYFSFSTPGIRWFAKQNTNACRFVCIVGKKHFRTAVARNAQKRELTQSVSKIFSLQEQVDLIALPTQKIQKEKLYESVRSCRDLLYSRLSIPASHR